MAKIKNRNRKNGFIRILLLSCFSFGRGIPAAMSVDLVKNVLAGGPSLSGCALTWPEFVSAHAFVLAPHSASVMPARFAAITRIQDARKFPDRKPDTERGTDETQSIDRFRRKFPVTIRRAWRCRYQPHSFIVTQRIRTDSE
jgi:hypothetical protein